MTQDNLPKKHDDRKSIPEIKGTLKRHIVTVPEAIYRASGIKVLGTRIKSFIFSTDVAILENHNAQAVMAVYPFTPQLSIIDAILNVSQVPVFVGVGGGVTNGTRTVNIALHAELHGAHGVVVNAPMPNETIRTLYETLDIPIVATIVSKYDDVEGKVKAGTRILNVSGGKNTASLVRHCREIVGPDFPIIATGGPEESQILETIAAGANSITYTPPTSASLFREIMTRYREGQKAENLQNNKKEH